MVVPSTTTTQKLFGTSVWSVVDDVNESDKGTACWVWLFDSDVRTRVRAKAEGTDVAHVVEGSVML